MKHEITVRREKRGLGHPEALRVVKRAVADALSCEGVEENCIVNVMLTDDVGIHQVNREFRGVDRPTDVLSFPFNEMTPGAFDASLCEKDVESGRIVLGDMMLSLERCQAQGEEFGHGFERELRYLCVHSVLHLLGYDHVDEGAMKKQMRDREKEIMGDLDE